MRHTLTAGIWLTAATISGSLPVTLAMAQSATETTADQADIPLQVGLYEPFAREACAAGISILYKTNLDRDVNFENVLPGVHSAMIEAALASTKASADIGLAKAKFSARAELHRVLTPQQLARLSYLFAPFVEQNSGRKLTVHPDDTMIAAVQRWLTGLAEDPGYQTRLKRVAAEPEMLKALNVAAPIMTKYAQQMQSIALVAMQAGLRSAKAKANAMAAAKNLAAPYPEGN